MQDDKRWMVKSQLVARLHAKFPDLDEETVKEAVTVILNGMVRHLSDGDRVEIRDFGVFALHAREARISRNPRTGEPVQVEAKSVVRFKPGKELKSRVEQG